MNTKKPNMSGQMSRRCPDSCHDFITTREAAHVADVSERTIIRQVKAQSIHSKKDAHRRLICRDSLMSWANDRIHSASRHDTDTQPDIATKWAELHSLLWAMIELYHPNSISELKAKQEVRDSFKKPP